MSSLRIFGLGILAIPALSLVACSGSGDVDSSGGQAVSGSQVINNTTGDIAEMQHQRCAEGEQRIIEYEVVQTYDGVLKWHVEATGTDVDGKPTRHEYAARTTTNFNPETGQTPNAMPLSVGDLAPGEVLNSLMVLADEYKDQVYDGKKVSMDANYIGSHRAEIQAGLDIAVTSVEVRCSLAPGGKYSWKRVDPQNQRDLTYVRKQRKELFGHYWRGDYAQNCAEFYPGYPVENTNVDVWTKGDNTPVRIEFEVVGADGKAFVKYAEVTLGTHYKKNTIYGMPYNWDLNTAAVDGYFSNAVAEPGEHLVAVSVYAPPEKNIGVDTRKVVCSEKK